MADPHFWAERPVDSSPKDITQFASGDSSQSDPDAAPHRIKDLDPGEYDIYVSDGDSGGKRGPTAHTQKSLFYKNVVGSFNPTVLVDHNFMNSNPILRARAASDGAEEDFRIGGIRNGSLSNYDNSVDIAKLYDKSGSGNDVLPASGNAGPTIVSGGSTVTNQNGKLTSNFSDDSDAVNIQGINGFPFSLAIKGDIGSGKLATLGENVVAEVGSNITFRLFGSGTAINLDTDLSNYGASGSVDALTVWNDYVWAGTSEGGLYKRQKGTTSWTKENTFSDLVSSFVEHNGDLWLSLGSYDVFKRDGSAWTKVGPGKGWNIETFDGNLFASYYGGLNEYDGSTWRNVTTSYVPSLHAFNGKLYAGDNRGGLNSINQAGGSYNYEGEADSYALFEMSNLNGKLVIISENNIITYNGSSFETPDSISNSIYDAKRFNGSVWLGGSNIGLQRWNENEGFVYPASFSTSSFAVDGKSMWAGDYSTRIHKISSQSTSLSVPNASGENSYILSTDGSTIRIYGDGQYNSTSFSSSVSEGSSFIISDPKGPLNGTIRRAVVFDRLLSQSEISELASYL